MYNFFESEYLEKYLKYEDNVQSFLRGSPSNKINNWNQIKSFRKRQPIPNNVIKLFYNQPDQFFSKYPHLLENTTYIDDTGNSIFAHYFYILYEKYKGKNATINFEIYESNFNSFFKENEKYFLVQDINLDTPFHKLAKFRNKGFFIDIYNKLKKIDLINNELLLTSNIVDETIFSYIFNEIKYKSNKLSNYEFYYQFINDNKSIVDTLPDDEKIIIDNFKNKVTFDIKPYKKENFNEIYNNINDFIKNKIKNGDNIFSYIYLFDCDFSYLNCLFEACSKKEDYDKLFDLVSLLSTKKEMKGQECISNKCIVNHIGYVLRKLNRYRSKSQFVNDYAYKLINQIFSKIENKESFLIHGERFRFGLLANIEMNHNLNMEQKAKLFDEFSKITKGKSDSNINSYISQYYKIYKALRKNNLDNLGNNKSKFLQDTAFILKLIRTKIESCNETDPKKLANHIKEFLDNNHYNIWKYRFDFSNETMENIYLLLASSELKGISHSFENDIPDDHFSKKIEDWTDKKYKEFLTQDTIIDKYLNDYLENNLGTKFFELLLSCPKDKSTYIQNNLRKIMGMVYEYRNDEKEDEKEEEKEKIIRILKTNLSKLKEKSFKLEYYYAFYLTISEVLNKTEILHPKVNRIKNFIHFIKTFNNINLMHLMKDINGPFDYTGFIDVINRYTLLFCKIFKGKKNIFLGIMKELDPNFNINLYSKIIDIYENNSKSNKNYTDHEESDIPEYLPKNLMYIMILFYIKKKYEKDIPYLVPFLLAYLVKLECNEIIKLFQNAFNTNNFNNIFDNFIFVEFGISNEKYKCIDYIRNNNSMIHNTLKLIKNSKCLNYKDCIKYMKKFVNGYAYYDYPGFKGLNIIYFSNQVYLREKHLESFLFQLDLTKRVTIKNIDLCSSIISDFDNIKELKKAKKLRNKDWIRAFNTRLSNDNRIRIAPNNNNDELDDIEEKIEDTDTNFYYLFKKIFDSQMSIFSFLDKNPKLLDKNILNHCTCVIEKMANESKNVDVGDKFYFYYVDDHPLNDNIINNFYLFLSYIKSDKNKFYDVIYDSFPFRKLFQSYFCEVLHYLKIKVNSSVENKRKDFIRNEIYTFLKKDEEFYNKEFFLSEESIVLDFTNSFINKIKKLKEQNDLKRECESFIRVVNNYDLGLYDESFFKQCFVILENLIEKNDRVFIEFLSNIAQIPDLSRIFCNKVYLNERLMSKCITNYVNNINEIVKIIANKVGERVSSIDHLELLNKLRKHLILNIIKSKKYELFDNSNIKNSELKIFNDLESSLSMLNDMDNKDGNVYLLKKIKASFCNDEKELFIKFISNAIRNNYIFETLFKTISKNKDKYFFETNKNLIISSLFKYTEINEYNCIKQLLSYISNFMNNDEISKFIYPSEDDSNNSEENKNKYLLFYALSFRNYEIFAVLLNYCQKEKAIVEMFPFLRLKHKDFGQYIDIHYINFVSDSKNLNTIKSLNKFLYDFSLFLVTISKQNDYINSLNETENNIYYYYKIINILEITPPLLYRKYIETNVPGLYSSLLQMKKNIFDYKGESELEWFIILALYEIKGKTLIPIKKYLPEFYGKIENYCKQFKSFKIHEICLKQSFDVKFHDNFISCLKNKTDELIKLFNNCYNIIFIIEKEYGNILDIQKYELYLQKAIFNLLNNNKISNIGDDTQKLQNFSLSLDDYGEITYEYNENCNNTFETDIIFSIKNFNRTSSIIIQKCFQNYDNQKSNILFKYICYLNYIKAICNRIILTCNPTGTENDKNKKNKDNIFNINNSDIFILKYGFQNNSNELISLLNGIDINQIKYHIIEGLKKHMSNKSSLEVHLNLIENYLKKDNISRIIKDTSNMTFLKFINILSAYCEIIINSLEKISDISQFIQDQEKNITIKLCENSKRNLAVKNFGQNLKNIISDYFNHCNTILNGRNDDFSNLHFSLNIYYYFDEAFGDYKETTSGCELLSYLKQKIDIINKFFVKPTYDCKVFIENDVLINIYWAMQTKNIPKLFGLIYNIKEENLKEVKKLFTGVKPIFDKFFEKNENFVETFVQIHIDNLQGPTFMYYLGIIGEKIKNVFNSYIIPALYANNSFLNYCEYKNDIALTTLYNSENSNYIQYIDFSELLLEIFNSKYHKDNNLDDLFKKRAINYILNNDSSLRLFIDEVYLSIYLKLSSANGKMFEYKKYIKDTFIIKIVKGKKIGNSEFEELKNIEEQNIRDANRENIHNKKKRKKLKLKLKTNKKQENIRYAFYKNNSFKREKIPSLNYSGHIPALFLSCGVGLSKIMTQSFGNEFLAIKREKKNLFTIEDNNVKRKGKKLKEICNIPFVNVYDLMFSVKSIERNEIIVFKHDISSILDNYSKPDMFESLLNHGFRPKNDEDVKINFDIIKNYVDENYKNIY